MEKIKVTTKTMNHYIVKQNANYADEFDVEGFDLCKSGFDTKVFKKSLIDNIEAERGPYPIECYFGTNEAVEANDRSELEGYIEVRKITPTEYSTIKKVVGESFGMTPFSI